MPLSIHIGDQVELKKNHPCGGRTFLVMRTGMDFRLQCLTCGSQIWLSRRDLEKRIKKLVPAEPNVCRPIDLGADSEAHSGADPEVLAEFDSVE